MTEIESFKNNASKTKSTGESAAGSAAKSDGVAGDGSHITYQLYYRPEQAKFTSNVKVSVCTANCLLTCTKYERITISSIHVFSLTVTYLIRHVLYVDVS